jgi:hypothetical protein
MISESLVRRAVLPFFVEVLVNHLDLRGHIVESARGMQFPTEDKEERYRGEIAEAEAGLR